MFKSVAITTTHQAQLTVVCFCADWCGSCREYQTIFSQIQQSFPQVKFAWVDIEEHDELIEDLEISTFPSVLIYQPEQEQQQAQQLFFGVIKPHPSTLQCLINSCANQLTSFSRLQPIQAELANLVKYVKKHGLTKFTFIVE